MTLSHKRCRVTLRSLRGASKDVWYYELSPLGG